MDSQNNLADMLNFSARTSTFFSVDVVGSTQIKSAQNEQDIIYTFLAYHKLVSNVVYTYHGEVATISGDGMMCRFQRAEDAFEAAKELLGRLPEFNKKQNHLTKPLGVRVGVHTGEVLQNESMASGTIISKTLDIAAKMQQSAQNNHAQFTEATVALLGDKGKTLQRRGWNAALGTNTYEYAPEGLASAASALVKLPDTIRILIIESEISETAKLKKALFGSRYDTFSVYNSNQANLAIQHWNPHMILMSLDLAWKAGWELLTSVRQNAALSRVPIVAMSNETTGDTIQKSFRIGANGFLRKPIDPQQVLKRNEMVLREFYL